MSALHIRALEIIKQYQKSEGDLLSILDQIYSAKEYLQMGYSSLFDYMVKGLSLSDSTAYSLQVVLRKSKEVPELKALVARGELSLCKAKRIAPVLTKASAEKWITIAKTSPVRDIDRQVAAAQPQAIQEKITPKSAGRSELKIGISHAFEIKLKRLQDLISNQRRQNISKEIALEAAIDTLLEQFATPAKILRAKKNDTVLKSLKLNPTQSMRANRTLTPKTKQLILARDEHRCTFVNPTGQRCENQRFLDIHHLKYRADGGSHNAENLKTLCSSHHAWVHRMSVAP